MIIKDSNDSDFLTISLDLAGCMSSLKQYCLTHGDTPWNPSSFSDQLADKFYQQVIDTENYNTCPHPTLQIHKLIIYLTACISLLQILIFLLQNLWKVSIVHKSFFGMTSKTLYVAGMKTESEFPDVYLDFIRQHSIPSALRRDHAKSEMSQRVRQIHRDLVIADQWTEPYCEDIGMNTSTNHKCLVEWNDINKPQSWVDFFALSFSHPTPVIAFARNQTF
jgi:hypothetical protein